MAKRHKRGGRGYSHPGYGAGERFPRPPHHRGVKGGGSAMRRRRSKRY